MSRRFFLLVLTVGAIAGGTWFARNFEVHGLDQVHVTRRGAVAAADIEHSVEPTPQARVGATIRIASFNIQAFGETKLGKPEVMQVLSDVVRHFDVVAIQEIRSVSQEIMPRFLAMINSGGGSYDFVIGPRIGRSTSKEQYAFVFNRASIELIPGSVYTVDDPDDRLHREPMVAGFTVRGPPPAQAFTFTLIDVHTDPDEVPQELAALDDVYRAVRDDGRHEDDIIIVGDFNADDAHMGELGQIPYLMAAISKTPSNTRGTRLYDNVLFDRRATSEFGGRMGVLNLMAEYHLSMSDAEHVSDHFPVWAEFSVYEGGQRGQVASGPTDARK